MLSPAVRAAAAQFATSLGYHPGNPHETAVVASFQVGYTTGYTAPRTARFPLAGDQAFKRLLGAYLAENITVYHPHSGRYGLLRGLPACYAHDGEPFAEVEFYADAEAREEGCGDITEPVGKLLPCLYTPEESEALRIGKGVIDVNWQTLAYYAQQVDAARALGIAVGLAPHQYHRRQPGFDYAGGGKGADHA